jgi:hypothetical protein
VAFVDAPDREPSDASGPAEADRDAAALDDERDSAFAAGQLEEARHRLRVLPHVAVLDPYSPGAEVLTGGGRVGSGILAVDLDGLRHRSLRLG